MCNFLCLLKHADIILAGETKFAAAPMAGPMIRNLLESWKSCHGSLCDSPITLCEISDILPDHPIHAFDAHWRALAGKGMPERAEFDPARVRALLKWLMVLEEGGTPEEQTFTVRLHGTAAAAITHGDLTGSELAEFTAGECYTSRLAGFRRAIAQESPLFGRTVIKGINRPGVAVSIGMFPFRAADGQRHHIVVLAAPDSENLRREF